MPLSINKIAIIGTGVIGAGWTLRLLAKKKEIYVFEPSIKQKKFLLDEIKRTTKSLKNFYKISTISTKKLYFKKTIRDAVKDVDLIQENVPENEKIKKKIVKEISKWSKPNAIIASSSSGLLPSRIQSPCKNPARFIIAHPFNPVYLLPLVEIVKGKKTKLNFIKKSEIFYRSLGMIPLIV